MSTIDHVVRPLDVEGILIRLSHMLIFNDPEFVISFYLFIFKKFNNLF